MAGSFLSPLPPTPALRRGARGARPGWAGRFGLAGPGPARPCGSVPPPPAHTRRVPPPLPSAGRRLVLGLTAPRAARRRCAPFDHILECRAPVSPRRGGAAAQTSPGPAAGANPRQQQQRRLLARPGGGGAKADVAWTCGRRGGRCRRGGRGRLPVRCRPGRRARGVGHLHALRVAAARAGPDRGAHRASCRLRRVTSPSSLATRRLGGARVEVRTLRAHGLPADPSPLIIRHSIRVLVPFAHHRPCGDSD